MFTSKISIILPAYNEEEALEKVVEEIIPEI